MSDLLTVRYPSGDTEFRMLESVPEVGEIVTRNDDIWVVHEVAPGQDGSVVVTLVSLADTAELEQV